MRYKLFDETTFVLEYRENSYFNDKDHYLVYDASVEKSYVTKLEFSKAYWWCEYKLPIKATSIPMINLTKLKGTEVATKYGKGILSKFQNGYLGIYWPNPMDIKNPLPPYWNDPNEVLIKTKAKLYTEDQLLEIVQSIAEDACGTNLDREWIVDKYEHYNNSKITVDDTTISYYENDSIGEVELKLKKLVPYGK